MSKNSGLCTKGCGFFGNANFDGMCSKCHKETMQREQKEPAPPPPLVMPKITPKSSTTPAVTPKSNSNSNSKSFKSAKVMHPTEPYVTPTGPSAPKSTSLKPATRARVTFTDTPSTPKSTFAPPRPPTPFSASRKSTPQRPTSGAKTGSSKAKPSPLATINENATTTPTSNGQTEAVGTKRPAPDATTEEEDGWATLGYTAAEVTDASANPAEVAKTATPPQPKKQRKQPKDRCFKCAKSIAVIAFDCRCGRRYCVNHRLAKEHQCNYDYKTAGAAELSKQNPKVVADKIQRI